MKKENAHKTDILGVCCFFFYEQTQPKRDMQTTYYSNGNKCSQCMIVNGKKHGLDQQWFPDGQKANERTYVDGRLHGLVQWWRSNGVLIVSKYYIHGMEFFYDDIQRADSRILLFKRRARMLGRDTLPSLEEMLGPEEDYHSSSWTQLFDHYNKERELSLF
jgi:hypothetical protein